MTLRIPRDEAPATSQSILRRKRGPATCSFCRNPGVRRASPARAARSIRGPRSAGQAWTRHRERVKSVLLTGSTQVTEKSETKRAAITKVLPRAVSPTVSFPSQAAGLQTAKGEVNSPPSPVNCWVRPLTRQGRTQGCQERQQRPGRRPLAGRGAAHPRVRPPERCGGRWQGARGAAPLPAPLLAAAATREQNRAVKAPSDVSPPEIRLAAHQDKSSRCWKNRSERSQGLRRLSSASVRAGGRATGDSAYEQAPSVSSGLWCPGYTSPCPGLLGPSPGSLCSCSPLQGSHQPPNSRGLREGSGATGCCAGLPAPRESGQRCAEVPR